MSRAYFAVLETATSWASMVAKMSVAASLKQSLLSSVCRMIHFFSSGWDPFGTLQLANDYVESMTV